jgi:hypothetical protein
MLTYVGKIQNREIMQSTGNDKRKMQVARWTKSRGTKGKSKCFETWLLYIRSNRRTKANKRTYETSEIFKACVGFILDY